jgi:hypothetical protein
LVMDPASCHLFFSTLTDMVCRVKVNVDTATEIYKLDCHKVSLIL